MPSCWFLQVTLLVGAELRISKKRPAFKQVTISQQCTYISTTENRLLTMIFLTDSSQWKEHWSSPHTLRQNHDFSVHLKNSSNCYIHKLHSAKPSQFDELFSNCNITWKIRQTTTHFNEKVQNQVNLTNYFQNSNFTWKICCFSVYFAKYERIFIKAEFSPPLSILRCL